MKTAAATEAFTPLTAEEIADNTPVTAGAEAAPAPIMPVPGDAPAATFSHPRFGEASATWRYLDDEGRLLFHVARFDMVDGKQILPRSWCRLPDGRQSWCWRGMPVPRPLYGLDCLAARPTATVLVVEGEKTADAAQQRFPDLVAVTWPGGSNAIGKADWTALKGRQVVVWPDADGPGRKAAAEVVRLVSATGAASVAEVVLPEDLPDGWDLADTEPADVDINRLLSLARRLPAEVEIPAGDTFQGIAEARDGDGGDGSDEPAQTEFTEDGLALEFTHRNGRDWAYVAVWGQWLVWNGTRWERETTLRAFDLARLVCRDAAEQCEQPAQKKKIASASTVAAVERLARADRAHAAEPDRWDRDPWLLNTPGGVVDLRTGRLQDHDRKLAMTRIATTTPVEYCPTWLAFLATITGGDIELQAYLQRVVGYCLTGVTTEHALFFLYGTGANGKSVFVNTIATILGDYATTAPMDMFMATTGERHPTDMAGLRGARLVTAIETEQGRRWAESKLKALTGGDKITARFMRQDFFEFVPQFKLIVAGNHKPSIRNVDEAMRRRLHLIPFTVTIPPGKRDKTLPERLLAEGEGILAWAVEGCLEWQRVGLKPPPAVAAATNEYFEAEDALGRWLDECCERGAAHSETTAALYDAWKSWAETSGEYAGSKRRFSENLTSRGLEHSRGRSARGFRGLRLRERGHAPPGWSSDG